MHLLDYEALSRAVAAILITPTDSIFFYHISRSNIGIHEATGRADDRLVMFHDHPISVRLSKDLTIVLKIIDIGLDLFALFENVTGFGF